MDIISVIINIIALVYIPIAFWLGYKYAKSTKTKIIQIDYKEFMNLSHKKKKNGSYVVENTGYADYLMLPGEYKANNAFIILGALYK